MSDAVTKILLLIVEDNPLQLTTLDDILVAAGYDVVSASSGAPAIEEIAAHSTDIKGVITDIKLGNGPDGWEVGRRAREACPTMPIVYVSGDSAAEWTSRGVPNSIMVSKPFAPAQIVTAISQLINDVPIV